LDEIYWMDMDQNDVKIGDAYEQLQKWNRRRKNMYFSFFGVVVDRLNKMNDERKVIGVS